MMKAGIKMTVNLFRLEALLNSLMAGLLGINL